MGVWVFQGGLAVAIFFVLVPLAAAPLLSRVYNRFGRAAPFPTILAIASGLYACSLLAFTTFPLPNERTSFCQRRSRLDYWQLRPGQSVQDVADAWHQAGLHALVGGTVLQVAFNVVFFVPLGFLLRYWAQRGLLVTAVAGLGASALIELTQGTGLWGIFDCPYRVADVDDLVTNTLGAAVGWLLAAALSRVLPYRAPVRRPDPGPPTRLRRIVAALIDLDIWLVVSVGAQLGVNAIGLLFGARADDLRGARTIVVVVATLVLFLLVPVLRRDRATIGQATLNLVLTDGSGESPGQVAVVTRLVLRWLPLTVLPNWLAVLALMDLVLVVARRDRRSLSELAARTFPHTVEGAGPD